MLYYDFKVGDKVYKLRLTVRNVVKLEEKLGCNPIAIFGNGDTIPAFADLLTVFHYSLLAMQKDITADEAETILDTWFDEGNTLTDFIPVIIEIYRVSGLIKTENVEKN